jgi:hypothetical protein
MTQVQPRKPITERGTIQPLLLVLIGILGLAKASGQIPDVTVPQHPNPQSPTTTAPTMIPHLTEGRFWISAQGKCDLAGQSVIRRRLFRPE